MTHLNFNPRCRGREASHINFVNVKIKFAGSQSYNERDFTPGELRFRTPSRVHAPSAADAACAGPGRGAFVSRRGPCCGLLPRWLPVCGRPSFPAPASSMVSEPSRLGHLCPRLAQAPNASRCRFTWPVACTPRRLERGRETRKRVFLGETEIVRVPIRTLGRKGEGVFAPREGRPPLPPPRGPREERRLRPTSGERPLGGPGALSPERADACAVGG